MTNINIFLRENLSKIGSDRVYVAPNIPEKKLNNLIKSAKYLGSPNNVAGIVDITLFGGGSDGLLFTGEQIIFKDLLTDPISMKYNDIISVDLIPHPKKIGETEGVEVMGTYENIVIKNSGSHIYYHKFNDFIQEILSSYQEFTEERQIVPLEEMTEAVKLAYLKIIVNMTYADDSKLDQVELSEMFLLMNRMVLTQETRFLLRAYMFDLEKLDGMEILLQNLNNEIPSGQVKTVHISLVKDLVNIYFSTKDRDLNNFKFLQENRDLFQITKEDLELIVMALDADYKLLDDNISDDKMTAVFRELSAKAAAVGTPLAAVYLSGSVIGMSAAGMTSGLAMLGMGGVLGLSSMATGIGVAVLLGVGAYKGVKKFTGANELSQYKRKQLMLVEVIKQTQGAISTLFSDINYIVNKLNDVTLLQSQLSLQNDKFIEQNAQLVSIVKNLKSMTGAGEILAKKVSRAEAENYKLSCPQFLDKARLAALTVDPTKQHYYDYILSFYRETKVEESKKDITTITKKLILKSNEASQLECLVDAFEVIGYFNFNEIVTSKAKNAITGLFS